MAKKKFVGLFDMKIAEAIFFHSVVQLVRVEHFPIPLFFHTLTFCCNCEAILSCFFPSVKMNSFLVVGVFSPLSWFHLCCLTFSLQSKYLSSSHRTLLNKKKLKTSSFLQLKSYF